MNRHTIVGDGRLLAMTGGRVGETGVLSGPWVIVIEDDRVAEVRSGRLQHGDPDAVEDVGAALVTPGLVDPHTHLIHAGDRSDEVAARSLGAPYTGGGILRTVAATTAASDDALLDATRRRIDTARTLGSTTVEIKSGYGLDSDEELRLLRLIARAVDGFPMRTRRTYLGAHAVPTGLTAMQQAAAVIEALPMIAPEADFIDVFCEPMLFDLELTRRIATAGAEHGLQLKLHADQVERSGAALLGAEMGALSVDHLEQLTDEDARTIAATRTVATILPGPALMLGGSVPPVRTLLDAGATVAIGSDANAGTFGEPSMPLAVGLAVSLGFSIDEALWAATAGAASALDLSGVAGILQPGASADLVAWDAEHEGAFAYRLGGVRPVRRWFRGQADG